MKKLISTIFSLVVLSFFIGQVDLSATIVPDNTGPGKVYECKGMFGGQKKLCMAENSFACSESTCF
ncbi:MAG: hypothetical protein DSY77_12105 [Bacteroidetes bacterium]|nr:MAG: hypothetical protein DSY77_12105 [Bacteroidota bacterium]